MPREGRKKKKARLEKFLYRKKKERRLSFQPGKIIPKKKKKERGRGQRWKPGARKRKRGDPSFKISRQRKGSHTEVRREGGGGKKEGTRSSRFLEFLLFS